MLFRPCIDLHEGIVKQIVGSTLKDDTSSSASSCGVYPHVDAVSGAGGLVTNFVATKSAREFSELYAADGLPGGHVIMLGKGNLEAAQSALRAYPGGLQVGGGITPDNAKAYLDAGASHVIVTSYVFRDGVIDWERLEALVAAVGKERLVLDLSCRKRVSSSGGFEFVVVTDRWQKFTDFVVSAASLHKLSAFCAEFLIHGVDVEGMRMGIDADLVRLLGEHSPIPCTYAGGVRDVEDLELVHRLGLGKVDISVGSALDIFGGSLSYDAVVAWSRAHAEPGSTLLRHAHTSSGGEFYMQLCATAASASDTKDAYLNYKLHPASATTASVKAQGATDGARSSTTDPEKEADIPTGTTTSTHSAVQAMEITHTVVSDALRGRGVAAVLAEAAFRYAQVNGMAVIPNCSYIRETFLPRNPQWLPLVQPHSPVTE